MSPRLPIIAFAALAVLGGCGERIESAQSDSASADPHAAHAADASNATDAGTETSPSPGDRVSLFDLQGEWTDQSGRRGRLADIPRRPFMVVTMLYTHCAVSCPRILVDLKRIEAGLSPALLENVRFVIASINPDRDTPERLLKWANDVRLDTARFTLLTAPDPTVRELAAVLRVRYLPEPNGEFGHTNRIVVVNADGEVVHWQSGLGEGATQTLAAITGRQSEP